MIQTFQKGAGENKLTYPLDHAQLRAMEPCGLVSPRVGKHHGIPMPAALCNASARSEALREVMRVREDVTGGVFPMWFMRKYYPEDWGAFPDTIPAPLAMAHTVFALPAPLSYDDPAGLANVVHMDHTHDLARVMLDWLIDEGARPNGFDGPGFDFLAIVPEQHARVSELIEGAMERAFDVKYYYGVPRPEEVAGENMTAYDEGAPSHPSFPAGHGAAAFATARYFLREWVLTDDQAKAVFAAAYVWSMARTFAGVHYAVDNLPFAPRRSEV